MVIDKSFAHFVKKDSRFWNISGINANINSSGMHVAIESLNSVVQGAVSFDSPADSTQAVADSNYKLYSNLQAAKRGIEVSITIPSQRVYRQSRLRFIMVMNGRYSFIFKCG